MNKEFNDAKFLIIGNNLAVDFVNTEIMREGSPADLLENPADLAAWASAAQILEIDKAKALAKDWMENENAGKALKKITGFRKFLRETIENLAKGANLKLDVLTEINQAMSLKSGFAEIVSGENGFEKRFRAEFYEPHELLAPIAEAFADILCYGNPAFLKKCESGACILYFYDTSKNHSRRWCRMSACGNRAKAAAFYERRKSKPLAK